MGLGRGCGRVDKAWLKFKPINSRITRLVQQKVARKRSQKVLVMEILLCPPKNKLPFMIPNTPQQTAETWFLLTTAISYREMSFPQKNRCIPAGTKSFPAEEYGLRFSRCTVQERAGNRRRVFKAQESSRLAYFTRFLSEKYVIFFLVATFCQCFPKGTSGRIKHAPNCGCRFVPGEFALFR